MKALYILFAPIAAFIIYLAWNCGNPVDYSKLETYQEINLDTTFNGKIQGTIDLEKGTYLIAVEYSGEGEFSISKWYPEGFTETMKLYKGMKKITTWIEVNTGTYDYEIKGILTINKIIIYK
jgi:hypothetical protein